jgi:AbrB family looped-hinge helix DNA binding protein
MESSNIVKVDSKGRILIPVQFRDHMGVEEGTEMIIVPDNDNNHFKVLPISKDATAEIRLMLGDMPSSLASVADALAANSFDILVSESRRMSEGLTEWRIIVDLEERDKGVETLRDVISSIGGVKSLDVVRK